MMHQSKRYCSHNRSRRGVQLLELLVSLTTASILVAGVGTSIFLTTKSRDIAQTQQSRSIKTQLATERLLTDLAEAKSIQSRSATNIVLTVADRDADGVDETLEYDWAGGNNPLKFSDSPGQWWEITDRINGFEFLYRDTPPQSTLTGDIFDPPEQYLYQSHTSASAGTPGLFSSDSGVDLGIAVPATYLVGDLLIAAVAVQADQADGIVDDNGWTKILELNGSNDLSLALFYTFNATNTSNQFSWPNSGRSYAAVAHFRPQTTTCSFDNAAVSEGNGQAPIAPAATAAQANSLVLRILVSKETFLSGTEDSPNLVGHLPILYRTRTLVGPALGIAYQTATAAGAVPVGTFNMENATDYLTATVVFGP